MTKLTPLQNRLLLMLEWFHDFCEKNGLTYYIVGGTMLGALRHRGFIPWDDDVDVIMPRPDYERLQVLLRNRIDNYVLENPYVGTEDYLYSFSKLYDVTTTMVEDAQIKVRRGVYIDVFPLDGLGNTYIESKRFYKKIDKLNMLIATKTSKVRKGRKIYKNIAIIVVNLFSKRILDTKGLILLFDSMCKRHSYETSKYVANCASVYRFKEIMKKSVYGKPTKYQFEDILVYGLENPEEYLSNLYGNWKELPPEDKRQSNHDFIALDLSKSYLDS